MMNDEEKLLPSFVAHRSSLLGYVRTHLRLPVYSRAAVHGVESYRSGSLARHRRGGGAAAWGGGAAVCSVAARVAYADMGGARRAASICGTRLRRGQPAVRTIGTG